MHYHHIILEGVTTKILNWGQHKFAKFKSRKKKLHKVSF